MDRRSELQGSEIEELRQRVEVAEETLRAIRAGEVDAIVTDSAQGKRVFILEGADRPYRLFVERMQQGAASLAHDGTVLYANASFAQMLGREEREILGRSLLEFVLEEQRPGVRAALAEESPAGSLEIVLLRSGGRTLRVHLSLRALSNQSVIGVLTDLTERRRREAAVARAETLRNSRRVLRRALEARKRAEAALRAADQRKDEFLAILSHELRNPLASIRNALTYLKLRESAHPDLERARDIIERQVQQTVRLIDDLMDVSRITRGVLELRPECFTLDDLLQDVHQACRFVIEENGHELRVRAPGEPLQVRGDRVRLGQVLGNLITNAAKYTPKGGRVELEIAREGCDLVVTVTDNGMGIPPDKLVEIFQPFERVDRSLERTQGGLGIGLALAERIVKLHGGTIEARSGGAGTGSQFVVRLPGVIAGAPAVSAPPPRPDPAAPSERRRVLVADDNDDAAESLAMLLRMLGHDAVTANDGVEAFEYAGTDHFDVAMLDIGMPRLNGYELARRIREQPWGHRLRLVALTGWGQESDKRRAIESGFDEHLTKPVDPERVVEILARPRQSPVA